MLFHCFLAYLKTAPQWISLGFSFGGMFLLFLMIFNKIKVLIPLVVQLKTMKNIIKKRIEFLKIILGDNF